jgi:hypothetical protein
MVFAMQVDGIKLKYKIQFAQSKWKNKLYNLNFPYILSSWQHVNTIHNTKFLVFSFFIVFISWKWWIFVLKKVFFKFFSHNSENSQIPILIIEKQISLLLLVHVTFSPFLAPYTKKIIDENLTHVIMQTW